MTLQLQMGLSQNRADGTSVPVAITGELLLDIGSDTSPELAIKIAYDFGRNLRTKGAEEEDFSKLLVECVQQPHGEGPLLPYIMAGFTAGFHYQSLPWRRQIEAQSGSDAPPPACLIIS